MASITDTGPHPRLFTVPSWPSSAHQKLEFIVTRATALEESRRSALPRKHFLENALRKHRILRSFHKSREGKPLELGINDITED